jgi:transcriptional regulator with XRE-family HTH domain
MSFGEKLKSLRKEKRWTQKELSEKIGTYQSLITDYENGIKMPRAETLSKIAVVFSVSVDYLLGLVEGRNEGYKETDASIVLNKLKCSNPMFELSEDVISSDQAKIIASVFEVVYNQVVEKLKEEGKLNGDDID